MNCRAPAHLCLETPGALEARKGCRAGEGGVARAHSRLGSRSRVTSAPASPNPKLTGTLTAPGTLGPWDPGTPPPPTAGLYGAGFVPEAPAPSPARPSAAHLSGKGLSLANTDGRTAPGRDPRRPLAFPSGSQTACREPSTEKG